MPNKVERASVQPGGEQAIPVEFPFGPGLVLLGMTRREFVFDPDPGEQFYQPVFQVPPGTRTVSVCLSKVRMKFGDWDTPIRAYMGGLQVGYQYLTDLPPGQNEFQLELSAFLKDALADQQIPWSGEVAIQVLFFGTSN